MKKIVAPQYILLIILGISLCVPHSAYAFPHHQFICPLKEIIMAVLGVTDDQREALDELKASTRAAIEPLAKEMRALARQMPEVLLAEEINAAEAQEKLDEVVSLRCQISSIKASALLKGAQILTPGQRVILLTFVEDVFELLKWIADFPGWDNLKTHFEEYIEPMLVDMVSKRLGIELTEDQIASFHQLKTAMRTEVVPLVEEMRELGSELSGIVLAEEINTVEAQEELGKVLDLRCQISSIKASALLEGVQILTPSQREIIKGKIEGWRNLCPWLENQ